MKLRATLVMVALVGALCTTLITEAEPAAAHTALGDTHFLTCTTDLSATAWATESTCGMGAHATATMGGAGAVQAEIFMRNDDNVTPFLNWTTAQIRFTSAGVIGTNNYVCFRIADVLAGGAESNKCTSISGFTASVGQETGLNMQQSGTLGPCSANSFPQSGLMLARWTCNGNEYVRNWTPLYWWMDNNGAGTSRGAPPVTPEAIPLPEASCARTIKPSGAGVQVNIAGAVANPDPDSTDTYATRFSWEDEWTDGAFRQAIIPTGEVMPLGGWRGFCRVTRTVGANPDARPPDDRGTAAGEGNIICEDDEIYVSSTDSCAVPSGGFVGVPPMPILPIPAILPKVPIPTTMPAPSTVPALAPGVSTVSGALGVGGAAIVGWLTGGALGTVLDTQLGMDQDWLCRWNPGYRALNVGLCENLAGGPQTRTAVQLQDASLNPATLTTWKVAHAYAEVLLDPDNPLRGQRTEVAVADPLLSKIATPRLTPTQTDAIVADATTPEPETATETENECPSGFGLLNPFNFGKVLRCLFIPSVTATATLTDTGCESFPLNVACDMTAGVTRMATAVDPGEGESCGIIDLRSVLQSGAPDEIGDRVDTLLYHLPTPSDSGCPAWDNLGGPRSDLQDRLGDVLGFRGLLRGVALVFLYIGFGMAVVRAFVDEDDDALEPTA